MTAMDPGLSPLSCLRLIQMNVLGFAGMVFGDLP